MATNTWKHFTETMLEATEVHVFLDLDGQLATWSITSSGRCLLVHPDGFLEHPVLGSGSKSQLAKDLEVLLPS